MQSIAVRALSLALSVTWMGCGPEVLPRLEVVLSGTGAGSVSSAPAGIDCGPNCVWEAPAQTVTLTAIPESGSQFAGWGGGCTGGDLECTLRLSGAQQVSARFDPLPDYRLAIEAGPGTATLGTLTRYALTLTGAGFGGPVALSVSGVPAGWAATLTPSTVQVSDGASASAVLEVSIPSDGEPAPAGVTLEVGASAAPGTRSVSASLIVLDEYRVALAAGTGDGPHWEALVSGGLRLRAGTTLRFTNEDASLHRIHSENVVFAHQEFSMGQSEEFVVSVSSGSDSIYCHDHGSAGVFALTVP